ncbi:tetratricopeptide repeat protein [uncultured Roseobacter sp.]|uniref:tetratricopeptide repeat protein n=1 Tax=uncultured Roseobacter sp. TaxID=114847 RepID=UPI00261EBB2B|nr:tetratricopeptide repeat protein [uncultured Roseobacter sp.]
MQKDGYDNRITTASARAAEAYAHATSVMLAGQSGMVEAFDAVTREDPGFALGWMGLGRAHHALGQGAAALAALERAEALSSGTTDREASHINAFGLLLRGQGPQAYRAIRAHTDAWPRDALVAQTCSSVFGLIGFSGKPGREAEILAFTAGLLPHYGADWWMTSQYAFALCETGNIEKADQMIDRSLAQKPENAHGVHVRSHIWYEAGATDQGLTYLNSWLQGYENDGILYSHLYWHAALWSLAQGDTEGMWTRVDAAVAPASGSASPAINILTDTVSILHRATLAGVAVDDGRWQAVSAYARQAFPATGNAFVDVHAALAHAMAGDAPALEQIITAPAGPAADLVPDLAAGYRSMAAGDWSEASGSMMRAMADLARIGGSRAQRDMVEQSLLTCLVRAGRAQEARDIAALRRPLLSSSIPA